MAKLRDWRWVVLWSVMTVSCSALTNDELTDNQVNSTEETEIPNIRALQNDLPVFPGAVGFGTLTTAGSGRHLDNPQTTVFRVTTLAASGPGSFQECVHASMPRICVFEVSGTIDLTGDTSYGSTTINVSHPYLTIAGQTAPSPGILIKGKGMAVRADHVLIQHIAFRVGDDPKGANPENRDAFLIIGKSDDPTRRPCNIVLDHISVSWGIDETFTAKDTTCNITLSNSIVSEGLNNSLHPKGAHSKGIMASADRISLLRNIIAHHVERTPMDTSPTSVHVNNLTYNSLRPGEIAPIHNNQLHNGKTRKNSFVNNIRINGPSTLHSFASGLYLVRERDSASQIRTEGLECVPKPWTGEWPCMIMAYDQHDLQNWDSKPIWHEQLNVLDTDFVMEELLQNSGTRPIDRDPVDARLIQEIRSNRGFIRDCVESQTCELHAGGWPVLEENYRSLNLPEQPNELTSTGYTRLEEWLFSFYSHVEIDSPSLSLNLSPIDSRGKNSSKTNNASPRKKHRKNK